MICVFAAAQSLKVARKMETVHHLILLLWYLNCMSRVKTKNFQWADTLKKEKQSGLEQRSDTRESC